ncbi:MAG TPA: sulfotransferase [Candidatus Saccharimonadia bacterium]|nr:sulfotransferase [Candidatus Saccharimonadia bacterium]
MKLFSQLNRPILVTGAPRSGTTILGYVLALPSRVTYLDEPFNFQIGMKGVKQQFVYLYEGSPDERYYAKLVSRLLAGQAQFKRHNLSKPPVGVPASAERLKVQLRQYVRYKGTGLDLLSWRYLLKDPTACFSSEYLHRNMQMPTVIIVRHPAAVIASYVRLGWRFSLGHLTEQSELMKRYLQSTLAGVDIHSVSSIEEGALLWNAIYSVLSVYADRNPGMIVIRHEDLSTDPEFMFESLYKQLGLPYNGWFLGRIREYTNSKNVIKPSLGVAHELHRNSRAIPFAWHDAFTDRELSRIRELTAPVADRFYGPQEWRRVP